MPLWGTLRPGDSIGVCDASIKYDPNGLLEVSDPYSSEKLVVRGQIGVLPAPPTRRPFDLGPTVYVEFTHKIFVEKGDLLWATIPVEVELRKKGRPIVRLATVKSKYTLVGSLVEGVIARYWRAEPIAGSNPPYSSLDRDCMALVAFYISEGADIIRGVPFNLGQTMIYTDNGGRLYFTLVEVSIKDAIIEAKTTSKPPTYGLKPLRKVSEGRGAVLGGYGPVVVVNRGWRLWPGLKT